MDTLITDALNFNQAVQQELSLSPIDLNRLIRGMIESYPEFQTSNAEISVLPGIPPVMGNAAGLTQCFSNLLGNAVKFVDPGSAAKVRIWAEQMPPSPLPSQAGKYAVFNSPPVSWVRIWIEDQGIGIPPEMISKVFDMFSRGHKSYEGTGIGLALVRKVVDRMGGKVGVESELGQGSRFWIQLQAATLH